MTDYAKLVPGRSRAAGTLYRQASVPGDLWYEVLGPTQRLGGETPIPGDPTHFVRTQNPASVGGLAGATPLSVITGPVSPPDGTVSGLDLSTGDTSTIPPLRS